MSVAPSGMATVASVTDTTQGMPYSRATIEECESIPPASATMPAARVKSGVQPTSEKGMTRMSPGCTRLKSALPFTIRAGPRALPRDVGRPDSVDRTTSSWRRGTKASPYTSSGTMRSAAASMAARRSPTRARASVRLRRGSREPGSHLCQLEVEDILGREQDIPAHESGADGQERPPEQAVAARVGGAHRLAVDAEGTGATPEQAQEWAPRGAVSGPPPGPA